ncbi:MAG: hypothetical protein ABGZ35_08690 [Planctomycetaceae bacterium]
MDTDPECPADLYHTHIVAFVIAFVQRERRERWLHLMTSRPKQLLRNSHKLHNHLDKTHCTESPESSSLESTAVGMHCDFRRDSPPLLISARRAIELSIGQDAIFSVSPGKHAIYFFHEGFVMECRA